MKHTLFLIISLFILSVFTSFAQTPKIPSTKKTPVKSKESITVIFDRRFETSQAVSALEFSSDDKWIAVGMTGGKIELRRSDDFSVVRELTFSSSSPISTIKISSDGLTLFAKTLRDEICAWQIATGKLTGCRNKEIKSAFSRLDLSDEFELWSNIGDILTVSKKGSSKPIKTFKIPQVQKNLDEFSRVTLPVYGLSFDRKILVHAIAANSVEQSEVFTGWIMIWDFERGRLIKSESIKNFTPQSLSFSHDNQTFGVGGEMAGQGFVIIGSKSISQ